MNANLKYFLRFLNPGFEQVGRLDIAEPVKADGQTYNIETENGRYGADVHYTNPDLRWIFWKTTGDPTENPQVLPDGQIIYYLNHGIEHLFEAKKRFGWQMKVELGVVDENNLETVIGEIDGKSVKTDGYRTFECNVIDGSPKSRLKRDQDTAIDVLSNQDVNGNAIDPLTLTSMVLQALPISATSEWKQTEAKINGAGDHIRFIFARQASGNIKKTLVPEYEVDQTAFDTFEIAVNAWDYVDFTDDANNTRVEIKVDYRFYYRFITGGGYTPNAAIRCVVVVAPNPYDDTGGITDPSVFVPQFGSLQYGNEIFKRVAYYKEIATGVNEDFIENTTVFVDIPFVPADYRLSVFWEVAYDTGHLGTTTPNPASWYNLLVSNFGGLGAVALTNMYATGGAGSDRTSWLMNNTSFKVSTTQTGINSVIKGVYWDEVHDQVALSICGASYPVLQPRFRRSGEHGGNIYFNGWGIRGFTTKPLLAKWKALGLSQQEPNCDYYLRQNDMLVQEYVDFYQNTDIGAFLEVPPESYNENFPPEYMIKLQEKQYPSYETDKDEYDTVDSVHTKIQDRFPDPNNKTEAQQQITFGHIRDWRQIETVRRQSIIALPTTALGTDDNIFMINSVPIANNAYNEFGRRLLVRLNGDGSLTILNVPEEGTASFGWDTLGIGVGVPNAFLITGGANQGVFTVEQIAVGSITIRANTPITTTQGNQYMYFKYFYTNVSRISAGAENFDFVDGIVAPQRTANLDYTFGNMGIPKWGAFWKACMKYNDYLKIRVTEFVNNGKLRTRKVGSSLIIQEDMDIDFSILPDAVIDPIRRDTQFYVPYARMKQLMNDIEQLQGFVRIMRPNGKVEKVFLQGGIMSYQISTGLLKCSPLGKAGSYDINIVSNGTDLIIAETGYSDAQLAYGYDWFEINNGYVKILDNERKSIITPTQYTEISINGVFYTIENDFRNAMLALRQ